MNEFAGGAGRFEVDTEGLQRMVPALRAAAGRFGSVRPSLEGTLDALGACWGGDYGGEEFVKGYAEPREGYLEALRARGKAGESTGEGVGTMAGKFEELEQDNLAELRRLAGSHGGEGTARRGTSRARPHA
jgi:hypothetical protein